MPATSIPVAAEFAATHAAHTAVGVGVLAGIVLVLATTRRRLVRELDPEGSDHSSALLPVALASLVAAAVHVFVIGEHADKSALYGAFFALLGVAQIAFGVAVLVRPQRVLLVVGAVANAAVVALWVVTRTVGVPVGPETGEVEAISPPDVLATVAEIVVVLGIAWWFRQAAISWTADGSRESSSLDMQATSMASASATIDESR